MTRVDPPLHIARTARLPSRDRPSRERHHHARDQPAHPLAGHRARRTTARTVPAPLTYHRSPDRLLSTMSELARTIKHRFYINAVLVSPVAGLMLGTHVMKSIVGIP